MKQNGEEIIREQGTITNQIGSHLLANCVATVVVFFFNSQMDYDSHP